MHTQTTRRTRPGRGRDRGNRARGPVDAEKMGDVDPRTPPASHRVARRVGRRAGRARDSLAGQRHRHRPSLGEHFDQFLWDAATKTTPGFRVLISGDEEKRPGSARGSPQRSTRNHPGDDGVREFLFDSEFHTTSQSRKSVRIRGVLSSESRPLAGWRFSSAVSRRVAATSFAGESVLLAASAETSPARTPRGARVSPREARTLAWDNRTAAASARVEREASRSARDVGSAARRFLLSEAAAWRARIVSP